MQTAVSYITYDTLSRGKTCNIITFTQFEERDLLSENHNDIEICNKSDENSTLAPLISE